MEGWRGDKEKERKEALPLPPPPGEKAGNARETVAGIRRGR